MTQMWQTTVSVMMNLNALRHVHGYRFVQWMHLHFEDHECKEAAYAASQLTVNL